MTYCQFVESLPNDTTMTPSGLSWTSWSNMWLWSELSEWYWQASSMKSWLVSGRIRIVACCNLHEMYICICIYIYWNISINIGKYIDIRYVLIIDVIIFSSSLFCRLNNPGEQDWFPKRQERFLGKRLLREWLETPESNDKSKWINMNNINSLHPDDRRNPHTTSQK